MLFNSYIFILAFLPITFLMYFFLNHNRMIIGGNLLLVFASLFFYGWWNVAYLPLICGSVLFNFYVGKKVSEKETLTFGFITAKNMLAIGVCANIALLGYFKYSDFFIENFNSLFGADFDALNLILPLAISFFTFQQIAYLVDCYRNIVKEYNFINYSLFVTFFPQLIAGPIVHHKEMMPQFSNLRNKYINYDNIAKGMYIFAIGLFKKVAIADTFASWSYAGYAGTEAIDIASAWATTLSFTLQIYFDFSGYADMAIGLGLLFNINLPVNFLSPWKAQSIQIFWRRWNITLTRFLREYIFLPLGGARKGRTLAFINLTLTFTIGGFWHGASWNFVLWGLLHGLALVVYIIWKKTGFKMPGWFGWILTFNFANIATIFFRAEDWDGAVRMLKGLVAFDHIILPSQLEFENSMNIKFGDFLSAAGGGMDTVLWIITGVFTVLFFRNSIEKLETYKPSFFNFLFMSFTLLIGLLCIVRESEFIYFSF